MEFTRVRPCLLVLVAACVCARVFWSFYCLGACSSLLMIVLVRFCPVYSLVATYFDWRLLLLPLPLFACVCVCIDLFCLLALLCFPASLPSSITGSCRLLFPSVLVFHYLLLVFPLHFGFNPITDRSRVFNLIACMHFA